MRELKSCAFFGGNGLKIDKSVQKRIVIECEKLVELGYGVFYFGGLGKFDRACYRAIKKLKETHPKIKAVYSSFYGDTKSGKSGYDQSVYFPNQMDGWYNRIFNTRFGKF